MSPLVRKVPIGMIANTAAKSMGMSGGIPGMSSAMTLGEAADNISAAKASMSYARAAAGVAGSQATQAAQERRGQLRDRVDSRLQRSFLRENPEVADDMADDEAAGEEGRDIYGRLTEKAQSNKRIMSILKRRERAVKEQIKRETTRRVTQAASRISLRAVNTAFGASVIGLIVVQIVWTIQLIAGNILGSKTIPPLELWEKICWALLTALLATIVIGALVLLVMILHPDYVIASLVSGVIKSVGDWLSGLFN